MEKNQQNSNTVLKLEQNNCVNLVKSILTQAKQKGADSAEVVASVNAGLGVSVRNGEVDTVEFNRDKGFAITLYYGKRKGCASTTDVSEASIASTIDAASQIAKLTQEDSCSGLADYQQIAFNYPDLDLYYPWELTTDEAITIALDCEKLALSMDKRITNSEGAAVSNLHGLYVYGNSYDFVGYYPSSCHTISCSLIAKQGNEMERDYYYTVARDPNDLQSIKLVAEETVKRTLARLDARRIPTGNYPVIFQSEVARSLFSHFTAAIAGRNLYRQSSFLLDHLDKKIFPTWVHIYEDPLIIKGNASVPFDAEGVRTARSDIIKDGHLLRYILSSYSARRLGLESTANAGGVHNLFVKSQNLSFQDLLRQMHTGLVVTELMGQGANLITGDYSRGAAGFWVENGEIQYPVHEITIASTLQTMFNSIVAIANDIDTRGNTQCGSVLIEQMKIAGV